jgi:hypothetical protein
LHRGGRLSTVAPTGEHFGFAGLKVPATCNTRKNPRSRASECEHLTRMTGAISAVRFQQRDRRQIGTGQIETGQIKC